MYVVCVRVWMYVCGVVCVGGRVCVLHTASFFYTRMSLFVLISMYVPYWITCNVHRTKA